MTKNTPFFLATVAILIMLGAGCATQNVINWHTYRDDTNGFEFKYPKNWLFDASTDRTGGTVIRLSNIEPQVDCSPKFMGMKIVLEQTKDPKMSFDAFAKNYVKKDLQLIGLTVGTAEKISLGGLHTYKYTFVDDSLCPIVDAGYLIEKNPSTYVFVYTRNETSPDLALIEKIIATFKFTTLKTATTTDPIASVPVDKDFAITHIASWTRRYPSETSAIFPILAYGCDIYDIKNGIALKYSKIDFFISKDGENAPAIFIGTSPFTAGGSGECDLNENDSSLKSKLEPGKYRVWAVRYIENKPDKRTPDVLISIVN